MNENDIHERLRQFNRDLLLAQNRGSSDLSEDDDRLDLDGDLDADLDFLRSQIPGYLIEEMIGRGGQATVWKAVQESTGKIVAIKTLICGPLTDSANRHARRFEREVSMLGCLCHPNIVNIRDSGRQPFLRWLVMDLVQGDSITEYADQRKLCIRDRVNLVIQVAHAIGAAHILGMIHRDIKPSNILVDEEGVPRVVDFGLARDVEELPGQHCSVTGEIMGTLPYASPEQLKCEHLNVQTDVYSLGVLLYELLTDDFPYSVDGDRSEIIQAIVNEEPRCPRAISADLRKIILKCLVKDPAGRYSNATELADDLRRWIDGEPVNAAGPAIWYLLSKQLRRHKAGAAIAALGILLAISGAVTAMSVWHKDQIARAAQIGMDAGGLVQLGNVYRDSGRAELARRSFESAVELTELSGIEDRQIMGIRYRALHRLAWEDFSNGELDRGRSISSKAASLAERMNRKYPDELCWKRHLASSHALRGKEAATVHDWKKALGHFEQSRSITIGIIKRAPSNTSCKTDLAFCTRWIGRCKFEIGDYSGARSIYKQARQLSDSLCSIQPEAAEHVLDIARCDIKLARCHIKENNTEKYKQAQTILTNAIASLEKLDEDHGLVKDQARLLNDLRNYLRFVKRKLSSYGLPESSSVSAGSSCSSASGSCSPTM
ncbi:MAG: serine/threonine protein kinase [Phycisphaerales bacterium]|nr:serine/threonine protein kinase [Phycisphaerales bacterium]